MFAFLLSANFVQANIKELTTNESGTSYDWNTASCFTDVEVTSSGVRFVHNNFTIQTPNSNSSVNYGSDLYLGYDYNTTSKAFTISSTSGILALMNLGDNQITVSNLRLGNGKVLTNQNKATLAGKITVDGAISEINVTNILSLNSEIVKGSSDACLNLKSETGEIRLTSTNANCPINVVEGNLFYGGSYGSNFAMSMQDGTSLVAYGNYLGISNTDVTINGNVRICNNTGTSGNKFVLSNMIVPEGSTLNAKNDLGVGAFGTITLAGELQGAGALVVDTVGSTNTNSLTLGHFENSFTGTVNVTSGKLQFSSVDGNVTYTGTNALIKATSVTVANGAIIDVGTTTQTLNNLSGAGNITLGSGGALSLSNTSDTEFTGVISGSGSLTKNGAKSLTLSGANIYTGGTTISDGTLKLTGSGTLGTGAVTVGANAALEIAYDTPNTPVNISSVTMTTGDVFNAGSAFKVPSGTVTFGTTDVALNNLSGGEFENGQITVPSSLTVAGKLTLNNDQLTKFIGSITAPTVEKTGLDTLQLCFDAQNAVSIGSLVVSSGRVDLKGYMQGGITVDANGIFSPGNSIGEATFGGGYILKDGATLLLEVGKDGDDVLTDVLNVTGDTTFEDGSIIKIALDSSYENAFEDGDVANILLPTGIKGSDGNALNLDNLVFQSSMFDLVGYNAGTGYLSVVYSAPAAGVPEPSTWALLLLGAAGLLYVRKRKN